MTAEMRSVTSDQALSVSVIQRPQDDSADAILDVVLTPSYVYYTASTVDKVVKFFTPPKELQSLDFSGLGAVATSQLERARRVAAEYAAAALSNKPRLRMKLDLEAPKVAIPVKDSLGEVSLALDLGRFIIETDPETAAHLSPEEAGLYECIRLTGSNVSAYAVDGAFDWATVAEEAAGSDAAAAAADDDAKEGGKSSKKSNFKFVPLLDRCGMRIGLQAARFPDPKYPAIRVSPTIPVLHFHFSPGRIGRLLRVINAVLPSASSSSTDDTTGGVGTTIAAGAIAEDADDDGGGGGEFSSGGGGGEEAAAWRARADCEGPLKVLTWTGLGRTTPTWCPRHAILYQGKLYLYENERSEKLLSSVSIWPDKCVLHVPPECIGKCRHVLAIRPAQALHEDLHGVAEDASSSIVRCENEGGADEWYRALLSAQQALQATAASGGGGGTVGGDEGVDWEVSSAALSSSDAGDVGDVAGMIDVGTSLNTSTQQQQQQQQSQQSQQINPDQLSAVEERRVLLQIEATLGEFAIFCSGREPTAYWPPPPPLSHSGTTTTTTITEDFSALSMKPEICPPPGSVPEDTIGAVRAEAAESAEVDGEVPIIVLRASGGSLAFEYGVFGMSVHTALASMEILDVLVGRKNPAACFLACSSKPSTGAVEVDEDVFFDPSYPSSSSSFSNIGGGGGMELSRTFSGMSTGSSAGGTPRRKSMELASTEKQDLAEFTLKLRRPGSKEYEGVDTALDVKLNTLFFFCNRPTVAALMAMGLDVSAASTAAFGSSQQQQPQPEEEEAQKDDDDDVCASPLTSPAAPAALESTTTAIAATAETLEGLQLLAAVPGGKRTMFAMSVTLNTLQVVLNYEGGGSGGGGGGGEKMDALAEACITDFSFGLSIEPDGGMEITSALGNLSAVRILLYLCRLNVKLIIYLIFSL